MIKIACVRCDHVYAVADEHQGQRTLCPQCQNPNQALGPEEIASQIENERRTTVATPAISELTSSFTDDLATLNRLRHLSDMLLLFAYLISAFSVFAGLLPFFLGEWSRSAQFLALIGGTLTALLLYLCFKFLSILVQALFDLLHNQKQIQEHLIKLDAQLGEREFL